MSVDLVSRPLWRARLTARAPRVVALLTMAILSAAGLRAAISGPAVEHQPNRSKAATHLEAESFAEAFTRAYLTWDSSRPGRHERQVRSFVSQALEPGAGLSVPASGAQQVVWTAPVQDRAVAGDRRLVTVAAETDRGTYYLSVPIGRDARGFLFVSGYPALVGPPAANTAARSEEEPEVEDPGLLAVVRRALANYLGRETANLRADLDSRAVVSLPPRPLRAQSIDNVTWVAPGRVAIELRVGGMGTTWNLRYELGVVKRDRWYVRSIQTNPATRRSE